MAAVTIPATAGAATSKETFPYLDQVVRNSTITQTMHLQHVESRVHGCALCYDIVYPTLRMNCPAGLLQVQFEAFFVGRIRALWADDLKRRTRGSRYVARRRREGRVHRLALRTGPASLHDCSVNAVQCT